MEESYFRDTHFQEVLLALLSRDRNFIKDFGEILSAQDFKPSSNQDRGGMIRWTLATIVFDFYRKYRKPPGELLPVFVARQLEKRNTTVERGDALRFLIKKVLKLDISGIQVVEDTVLSFKRLQAKTKAIEELVELQSAHELTDDRFLEIARDAVRMFSKTSYKTSDYSEGLSSRLLRRRVSSEADRPYPFLFMGDLDMVIKSITSGQIGLILAPTGRGKGLCLQWIAMMAVLQGFNTLYFTLEDPIADLEDRLDAAMSSVPMKNLVQQETDVQMGVRRKLAMSRARLKLVDGTETKFSVAGIEEVWSSYREEGFDASVVIVDYDAEILSPRKYDQKRLELGAIYSDLRRFAARRKLIVWTASQSRRGAESKKIIGIEEVAEDKTKIDKATLVLSIGKLRGPDPDGVHLWVAKHRHDRSGFGVTFWGNRARAMFYDSVKTAEKERTGEKDEEDSFG